MNLEVSYAFIKCLFGLSPWLIAALLLFGPPLPVVSKKSKVIKRRIISQTQDNRGRPVLLVEAQNAREAGRFVDGWTYPGDCSWKIQSQGKHEYMISVWDWDNK